MLATWLLFAALQPGMVRIAGGEFKPLFAVPGHPVTYVATFAIDKLPVTQKQFANFDERFTVIDAARPVTGISWRQADAYCRARGKRLPTTYEWEYVARADEKRRVATHDPSFKARVLDLALRTGKARGFRNVWGVSDLHGVVFEWTHDYNGHVSGHHGHGKSTTMCAAGTVQTGDPSDYAAFIRYSFRSTADADLGAANVGFRCAL